MPEASQGESVLQRYDVMMSEFVTPALREFGFTGKSLREWRKA
jgi:hypothetical protein